MRCIMFHRAKLAWAAAALMAPTAILLAADPAKPKDPGDSSPTLITLDYTNAPAETVLTDLFNQTGFPYEIYNDGTDTLFPPLTIQAQKQPYWQVVSSLNDTLHTSMILRRNGKVGINRYSSASQSAETGPASLTGPCMVLARYINHKVDFTAPQHTAGVTLHCMLLIEPHFKIATFPTNFSPDSAVDERGNSLLCNPAPTPQQKQTVFGTYSEFDVPLQVPPNGGYRIASLKATMHLMVAEKSQVIEIAADDFAKEQSIDFMGATLRISPVRATPSPTIQPTSIIHRVSIDVRRNELSEAAWEKVNELLDAADITMYDDQKMPLSSNSSPSGRGRVNAGAVNRIVGGSFTVNTDGRPGRGGGDSSRPPVKAVIAIPTLLSDIPLQFEFKNLVLP